MVYRLYIYPTVKKCLFVLTECTNVTDTRRDGRTDRHRMMARPRLRSIAQQKNVNEKKLKKYKLMSVISRFGFGPTIMNKRSK